MLQNYAVSDLRSTFRTLAGENDDDLDDLPDKSEAHENEEPIFNPSLQGQDNAF